MQCLERAARNEPLVAYYNSLPGFYLFEVVISNSACKLAINSTLRFYLEIFIISDIPTTDSTTDFPISESSTTDLATQSTTEATTADSMTTERPATATTAGTVTTSGPAVTLPPGDQLPTGEYCCLFYNI